MNFNTEQVKSRSKYVLNGNTYIYSHCEINGHEQIANHKVNRNAIPEYVKYALEYYFLF